MAQDLAFRIRKEDAMLRKMFAEAVIEKAFLDLIKKDPSLFHQTLELTVSRNWLKPARLAEALDVSESNTRKWFKTKVEEQSTPNVPTRVAALQKVSALMQEDIRLVEVELASFALRDVVAEKPVAAGV